MQIVDLQKWQVRSDPELTREAYAEIDAGGAELCGCEPCFNFAAVRHLVYSPDILELFDCLGIDPLLEAGAEHAGRLEPGLHAYAVWFYLVGEIASGPPTMVARGQDGTRASLVDAGDGIGVGLCTDEADTPDAFIGFPVVQLALTVSAPWVSNAPEPLGD